MSSHDHYRRLLLTETAHFTKPEFVQLQCLHVDAVAFSYDNPDASPEAISDKLLTLYPGTERWVRVLVAKAAQENNTQAVAA